MRRHIPPRKPPQQNINEVIAGAAMRADKNAPMEFPDGRKLPFRPGTIIRTEREKKDLTELGFEEGQALPGDFAQRVAAARAAEAEDLRKAFADKARSGETVKLPKTIDIKDLSPARRQKLRDDIAQATAEMDRLAEMQQQQAELASLHPSIRAAAMQSAPGIELFDSTAGKTAESPAPPEPPAATAAAATPPAAEPLGTGVFESARCVRCNHPVGQTVDIKPTREDIISFEISVASVDATPFLKSYSLFGGRIEVIFRSKTRAAVEAINTQYRIDRKSDRFLSPEEGAIRLQDYLTVLGLHSVRSGNDIFHVAEDVDSALAVPYDAGYDTPLYEISENMKQTAPFSNESLWRAVRYHWQQFDDLVQYMEARAPDPSFWEATGT